MLAQIVCFDKCIKQLRLWLMVFVLLLTAAVSASAQGGMTVTLVWDSSLSQDVASYNIYYGTRSGYYTNIVTVDAASNSTQISGLEAGTTYFFAVTAVDSINNESDFSTEVYFSVPTAPKLLSQIVTDVDGNKLLEISTIQVIQRSWFVEYSEDMVNWYVFDYGFDSAVDEWMPITNSYFDRVFFRLVVF